MQNTNFGYKNRTLFCQARFQTRLFVVFYLSCVVLLSQYVILVSTS